MDSCREKTNSLLRVGLDIGSTTIKAVVLDKSYALIFKYYTRHNAEINITLQNILQKIIDRIKNKSTSIIITGSAGMGIAESFAIPFIQEVIAASNASKYYYPNAKMLIDIGGEDSKLVYFKEKGQVDIRMNGNCAGGTGSFIDQVATLLDLPMSELDGLAKKHKQIFNIASRCGVFAKTDVQTLLSNNVSKADIIVSTFHAIAHQTLNTLLQGYEITPKILLTGGPFYFFTELCRAFIRVMNIKDNDIVVPQYSYLISAIGAAMTNAKGEECDLEVLLEQVKNRKIKTAEKLSVNKPLFESQKQYDAWKLKKEDSNPSGFDIKSIDKRDVYVGIDAGSTTSKVVVVDDKKNIVFKFYKSNKGNHIGTVKEGLNNFYQLLRENEVSVNIKKTGVTGYGEDLIRSAFSVDYGFVETLAHYRAAKYFKKDVSFILDIGGQDMKAISVRNGVLNKIEINEACSSGCGSFIETFAHNLNYKVEDFAEIACLAEIPYDLGTRCTVFMNSKVKQALKEGTPINNIAAGLSYSIIRNCFNKVFKIRNFNEIGDQIVAQGGTFLNPSVLRALELYTGKNITRPYLAQYMGAYGVCLLAIDEDEKQTEYNNRSNFIKLGDLDTVERYDVKHQQCKGCTNNCKVSLFRFDNGAAYHSGHRCEKFFGSTVRENKYRGRNLWKEKYDLIFNRKMQPSKKSKVVIGIPRVLNIYTYFPFWCTLFVESGLEVVLSSPSTFKINEYGTGTVASENICFPAKLAHGHIIDLINKGVDRIFYPMVIYDKKVTESSHNSFTCPVVAYYPEVLKGTMSSSLKYTPFDSPAVSFADKELLKKMCVNYLKQYNISKEKMLKAFDLAIEEMDNIKKQIKAINIETLDEARKETRPPIMLIGKPYHLDPLVNHNIPEMITSMGFDVLTEDVAEITDEDMKEYADVVSQWETSNIQYCSVNWLKKQDDIYAIQLNSFGCGIDSISIDEVKEIIEEYNKPVWDIRIDEMTGRGALKLRIRSILSSLAIITPKNTGNNIIKRKTTPIFYEEKSRKTIIVPDTVPYRVDFLDLVFKGKGVNFKILPKSDRESVEIGLKYVNNDTCYPGIIMIGDIIKALLSGNYDVNNTAACIYQVNTICRACNYASLLKKALIETGFDNVPVVTLPYSLGTMINIQPGFDEYSDTFKSKLFSAFLLSDQLTSLYYATAVREKHKGNAHAVLEKYLNFFNGNIVNVSNQLVLSILRDAVEEFNSIEINKKVRGRVGIIGEVYCRYNRFANNDMENWLMDNGVEVFIAGLIPAIMRNFINIYINNKTFITKSSLKERSLYFLLEKNFNYYIRRSNKIVGDFKHSDRHVRFIRDIAKKAEKIVSLNMQVGEGWTMAGEVALLYESGINNVVCIEPFGCLQSHIAGKGIRKKIERVYPDVNMLYINVDPGDSKTNIFNRLNIFLQRADNGIC